MTLCEAPFEGEARLPGVASCQAFVGSSSVPVVDDSFLDNEFLLFNGTNLLSYKSGDEESSYETPYHDKARPCTYGST